MRSLLFLLAPVLIILACGPREAAAKYGSPCMGQVADAARGAMLRSSLHAPAPHRQFNGKGNRAAATSEHVDHGESAKRKPLPLPLLADRNGQEHPVLPGHAARSFSCSAISVTWTTRAPYQGSDVQAVLERTTACRRSAGQAHQLRAPPSLPL